MIKNLIELLRVKQYIKNGLVFVPLIFSQHTFGGITENIYRVFFVFIAFCFVSSAVYIFNDIVDKEEDKHHPVKSKRPIPSNKVVLPVAISTAFVLFVASMVISFVLGIKVILVILAYIVTNILYSSYFKRYALFDIFVLSLFFLLRIYAGAVAINVNVSAYLFLAVFFLSLYLASGKRRYELLLLGEEHSKHRLSLKNYSVYYLDQLMLISSTITLVIYSLYAIDSKRSLLMLTVPIVTFGLFRYYHLTHNKQKGEPSDDIISDKVIIITAISYLFIITLSFFL